MQQRVDITLPAILAALFYHAMDTKKVRVKAETGQETEVDVPLIQITQSGNAVCCTVPVNKCAYYALTPYDMQVQTYKDSHGTDKIMITFDKQSASPTVLGANGAKANVGSEELKALIENAK